MSRVCGVFHAFSQLALLTSYAYFASQHTRLILNTLQAAPRVYRTMLPDSEDDEEEEEEKKKEVEEDEEAAQVAEDKPSFTGRRLLVT